MTTLREKINQTFYECMWSTSQESAKHYTDKVMQAIKSKYGWTDKDCPFSYGDEIEVGDEEIDLYKATFISFLPQCEYPYHAIRDQAGLPTSWKYARPIQKQEVQTTTWQIELNKLLLNETILESGGKKYKLVEVE